MDSDELKQLRLARNKAFRVFRKNPTLEGKEAYRMAAAAYQSAFEKAKAPNG